MRPLHRTIGVGLPIAYAASLLLALLVRRTTFARATPIAALAELLPASLAPLPLLVCLASRKRAIPVALGLAGLAGGALYARRPRKQAPQAGSPALRVLSANLLRGVNNTVSFADLVLQHRPDFVAAQELDPPTYGPLAERLAHDYPHHFSHAHETERGLGIWSRHPIIEQWAEDSDTGHVLVIAARLDVPGGPITFATAHPRVPDFGPRRAGLLLYSTFGRDRDVERVLATLRVLPGPQVLVGDFNFTHHSAAHATVTRWLVDSFEEAGHGLGHTFPVHLGEFGLPIRWPLPLMRLDYVFHTPDLRALSAAVLRDVGSDHLPLFCALERVASADHC